MNASVGTPVNAALAADSRVPLLHRAAEDYFGGPWELPSGGVDTEVVPEARRTKDSLGLIQHLLYPLL
ncbi:hypothetical protein [Streptomyces zagrosensis]|uniref:Uncharacterized protein n=1 Tax=Streptomyces zagrosensis TaxID=1042984 RepID=A0A7W9QAP2_9ACTN|nr:hypothetical protein [Streptomyces zagrosensis]MBB5936715.1 hypothetical protein [Streptomyces zagrosensis]